MKRMVLVAMIAALASVSAAAKGSGEAGTVPKAASRPVELKVWAPMHGYQGTLGMKSYGESRAFQELERRLNVKITWSNPTNGPQANEQFNLMVASGDLPDMISKVFGQAEIAKLADDGVVIPLKALIQKKAPNLKKTLESYPELRRQVYQADGEVYYAPYARIDPVLREPNVRLLVRQDWLTALKIGEPDTLEDWHAMLKAFRGGDPNGNGKQDEIPFTCVGVSSGNGTPSIGKLAWEPFGAVNDFMQADRKVVFGPTTDAFRSGIEFGRKLIQEGLVDPDFLVQTWSQVDQKILSNLAGSWYSGNPVREQIDFKAMIREKAPSYQLLVARFPKGPDGVRWALERQLVLWNNGKGLSITSKSKNVDACMALIDYSFSPEGDRLLNFGTEGDMYTMKNGREEFGPYVTKNPDGLTPIQTLTKHTLSYDGFMWGYIHGPRIYTEIWPQEVTEPMARRMEGTRSDAIVPQLPFTAKETQSVTSRMNDIRRYTDEMVAKFLLGTVPMGDYAAFTERLRTMGIGEVTALYQAAYDRYLKN